MLFFGKFIQIMSFLEDDFSFAGMSICWTEKLDSGVVVLITVPAYESGAPSSGLIESRKAFRLIIRSVLQCFEDAFRVCVVVAYAGSAV